jgi:OOP family OmpA-OmpF porin
MKLPVFFSVFIIALMLLSSEANAQVKINLKGKVKREADKHANQKADQAVDAAFDKLEEGIKGIFKKKNKNDTDQGEDVVAEGSEEAGATAGNKSGSGQGRNAASPTLSWSKYDFVPGDKIIFEDNQENEENGEFPSRWDLVEGRVENAVFDNQNVIYFMTASSKIIPYLKNREHDYLPDEFTLEFDAWFEADEYTSYIIWFRDVKNQENAPDELYYQIFGVTPNSAATLHNVNKGIYPNKDYEWNTSDDPSFWRHVSVSFNRRALKVYLDETRLLNVPNMEINPVGITIGIDNFGTAGVKGINRFIKNVRIAEGAVKLYDKLLQDGKIITNGIRFDVNKATLKPESMGVINEIATLMNEYPEIKFSVEGHTDSDGDDAFNQTLSEQRASTVVNALTKIGIDAGRLTSNGWGENKPLDTNATPEGKANNRRVEFVKI